ncbi:LexA family protein [Caldovatus aquaticus]|uniref:Peptidase S24/S26A/S26B/S26C domain-containing protein n=1 Tax=Caldovatus aquaticus TaxID=2865671 RepID=A0ABS7EYD7_9PROT|nr:S24 family peptidase [Caldovatus aquaticus]MBW8268304.1 hypothetical protein [Caldovatus aquaticus]
MGEIVRLRAPGGRHVSDDAETVRRLQAWMRRAMANHHPPLSAEAWANKAGVAGTSITRFLKHGYPVPKTSTLAKLAAAIGLQPPDLVLSADARPFIDIPVIVPALFRSGGLERAVRSSVEVTRAPAKFAGCVAVRITTGTGILAGILPGDLVVVDPGTEMEPGDLVVVALDTGDAAVYRVQEPWLVPATVEQVPPLRIGEAHVIGVAVQVQRELPRQGR